MVTRRNLLAAGLAAPAFLPGLVRAQADARPVLRVAVQALPPTLEPFEAISNVGLRSTCNVFDTLWRRDFNREAAEGGQHLLPHLATSLQQREPLTWEAKLRDGVRMHDGSVLSAEDVLSTFSPERMYGKEVQHHEGRVNFGHLTAVEAEGRDTVVFRTATPDVAMPQRLASYGGWIHSAKFYKEQGLAGMRQKPVGSGPYRIASFQRNQRLVLESHDEYWMSRPAARQIILIAVPEAATRLAGLHAGDFDLVTNLLPEQAETFRGSPTLEGVEVVLDLAHILYYDTRNPMVRDARVRRGLNHAVDMETLGKSLWGPNFQRMAALQTPAFGDYYDAGRRGHAYDPDLSRKLLKEGGYKGEEVVIRIAPGYYLQMDLAVQVVQQMWEAVGVRSRLETVENVAQVIRPGADVRPISVSFRFPDPLGGGLMVNLSKDYSTQKSGFWQPVKFNAISDELKLATDPAERKRLWLALMDEYEAEAPALTLYQVREYFAKRRDVRWNHYPLYYMDFRPFNLSFA